jgi:hypothetical protein
MSDQQETRMDLVRGFVARTLFAVWVPVVLLIGSYLMGAHLLTLPKPSPEDPGVRAAVAQSRRPDEQGKWLTLHLLYAECGCSQNVLAHLLTRRATPDGAERIVFIGHDDAVRDRATRAGFGFEAIAAEALESRYLVVAAPLMIVVDPTGAVRYVGGYTDRKKGRAIHDVAILTALHEGRTVAALPTFGCAVSRKLKGELDPFNLNTSNKP